MAGHPRRVVFHLGGIPWVVGGVMLLGVMTAVHGVVVEMQTTSREEVSPLGAAMSRRMGARTGSSYLAVIANPEWEQVTSTVTFYVLPDGSTYHSLTSADERLGHGFRAISMGEDDTAVGIPGYNYNEDVGSGIVIVRHETWDTGILWKSDSYGLGMPVALAPSGTWLLTSWNHTFMAILNVPPDPSFSIEVQPSHLLSLLNDYFPVEAHADEDTIIVVGCTDVGNELAIPTMLRFQWDAGESWIMAGNLSFPDFPFKCGTGAEVFTPASQLSLSVKGKRVLVGVARGEERLECLIFFDDVTTDVFLSSCFTQSESVNSVALGSDDAEIVMASSVGALKAFTVDELRRRSGLEDLMNYFQMPNRLMDDACWPSRPPIFQVAATHDFVFVLLDDSPSTPMSELKVMGRAGVGYQWSQRVAGPVPCIAGTESRQVGFSHCWLCPAGSFKHQDSAELCQACAETSYCPVGAVLDLPASDLEPSQTTVSFVTTPRTSSFQDMLFFNLFTLQRPSCWARSYCFWGLFWTLFVIIALIFASVPLDSRWNRTQVAIKNTIRELDMVKGQVKYGTMVGGVVTCVYLFFFCATFFFAIRFFFSYEPGVNYDDPCISNINVVRSTVLQSYDVRQGSEVDDRVRAIAYNSIYIRLRVWGVRGVNCTSLCQSVVFETTDCRVESADRSSAPCSERATRRCFSPGDYACVVEEHIPSSILMDFFSTCSFRLFAVRNMYIQALEVELENDAQDKPFSILGSRHVEVALLKGNDTMERVLFGTIPLTIQRTHVITGTQPHFNVDELEFTQETVYSGVLRDMVQSVDLQDYYYDLESLTQTVHLDLETNNFWVYNEERKIINGAEIAISVILCSIVLFKATESLLKMYNLVVRRYRSYRRKWKRMSQRRSMHKRQSSRELSLISDDLSTKEEPLLDNTPEM